jgi:hypothetical protein
MKEYTKRNRTIYRDGANLADAVNDEIAARIVDRLNETTPPASDLDRRIAYETELQALITERDHWYFKALSSCEAKDAPMIAESLGNLWELAQRIRALKEGGTE